MTTKNDVKSPNTYWYNLFLRARSDRASAAAAASSLVMDYIDLYLCHSDQVAVAAAAAMAAASLAMTLGIALGPIWIFDASDAADADARSERALSMFLATKRCQNVAQM